MDYAIKIEDVTKILREQVLSIEEKKEKSEWYKLIKQNGGSNRVHRFFDKNKNILVMMNNVILNACPNLSNTTGNFLSLLRKLKINTLF